MKKLTRKKALELIPLIVDGEASEQEKNAFFSYIQTDNKVKKKYESLLFLKQLIKTKYSREKTPDHLRNKITGIIRDMEWEQEQHAKVDNSKSYLNQRVTSHSYQESEQENGSENVLFKFLKPARYLAAAAVIFIFSLLTIELLEQVSSDTLFTNDSVEQLALDHFSTGDHIEASVSSFQPSSFNHATELLQEQMSYSPRLPDIKGAELRRIFHTSFSENYTIPVLEFYQPDIDETIHVFAFKIDELKDNRMVKRDPEAIKLCKTYEDYHIKEIKGKHVVSWKWGEYWYTAVSNHNGNDLVALVEPTEQKSENKTSDW